MDKLGAMQAFVDIVDSGSLSAAAASKGRSLPTMVRTLAALERGLGARLLRRTTRRMSLTPEGRDYLVRCRRILSDVEEAESAVAVGQTEPRGVINMTALVLFGQQHVAPAVTALIEEGIDLAVRIGPLEDSSMVAVPVGHMRRVLCASPEFLAKHGMPREPSDLNNLPCALHRTSTMSGVWHFQQAGQPVSVPVQGQFVCSQAMAVAQAGASGTGLVQLLHYQVCDLIAEGRLVLLLTDYEVASIPVSLIYPEGLLVSTRVRALVTSLRDSLAYQLSALA
jgi:DNA-binding transcriptional LysR family regulator